MSAGPGYPGTIPHPAKPAPPGRARSLAATIAG
jgi:hypothetical protein